MDPIMIQHISRIRQQEILETAANERNGVPYREVLWHVGRSLVTLGQGMMKAAKPTLEEPRFTTQATSDNCY
jgi:hypothetical protein